MRWFLILLLLIPDFVSAAGMWGSPKAYSGGVSEATFGYDTDDLDASYSTTTNYYGLAMTTGANAGTLTELCVRIGAVDGVDPEVKLGLYETSGGDPNGQSLVAEIAATVSVGINCIAVVGTPAIAASTTYVLHYISNGAGTTIEYKSTTASGWTRWKATSQTYAGAFQATCPSSASTADQAWGLWAKYEY